MYEHYFERIIQTDTRPDTTGWPTHTDEGLPYPWYCEQQAGRIIFGNGDDVARMQKLQDLVDAIPEVVAACEFPTPQKAVR
ncbi:hypothetical protein B1A87_005275 [Arthrobacter sp. KBS0703]|uniref:hypothetical protein n=1 Tax=Arthrobacter sp. KBS0703 TaxID=1955698 RepID=UPI00098EE828|nr:hypothetical protein [Arthrobacter sp. KBS0703]TSE15408.1 hypothetical protein B1A87_005275 [Arthrobacter sp. KBS0703]